MQTVFVWSRISLVLLLAVVFNAFVITAASAGFEGKGSSNPRMANSPSPYLQSHAKDLVRWYTWGEEAFAKAKRQRRPLFVSFGYTACHWCHVMQEKHFNDFGIAKMLNENFVPVLVDREQHTAIDDSYMLVTELLTQQGGWPNNVFMIHDLKPFYGTGYIPPEEFSNITSAIVQSWDTEQPAILSEGERLSTALSEYLNRREEARSLTPDVMKTSAATIVGQFDKDKGGMGSGPRFFRPTVLAFLLQQAERTGDKDLLKAVETTLQAGMKGGINDHIEGGFHRYTVDPGWRVPHFEKMLNDQALVSEVYVNAFRITGNSAYAKTARQTLDYVLADLTSDDGGFFTSRDADSEGEEGTYYVWTPEQLVEILGAEDAEKAIQTFGLIADGEMAGKVIINKDSLSADNNAWVKQTLDKLATVRSSREKPIRDEKTLANWNGMMMSAMAQAGLVLGDTRYTDAAIKAGDFIWANMHGEDDILYRSRFNGQNSVEGELDDYGHVARGYLFIYDATNDKQWLERASPLIKRMRKRFEDPETGDFFGTREAAGFARVKPRTDVDQPSGNGAALDAMVRLAMRDGTPELKSSIEKTIAGLSGLAAADPVGGASILTAADTFLHGQQGPVQYAGNGVARAEISSDEGGKTVRVRLNIAPGWHINSDAPLEDYLIATKLDVNSAASKATIVYPKPLTKKLGFSKKPLSLLEGQTELMASFAKPVTGPVEAKLQVQACSDEICLLPEQLTLKLIAPGE